ncbi:MAG: hypothetical protein RR359_04200 [Bacilli bacterium]
MYNNNMPKFNQNMSNDRFGGGFLFPFILGGLVSPLFTNKNNKPCCMPYPYYPMPYPTPYPYQYGYPYSNQYQPEYNQNLELEKNYYF